MRKLIFEDPESLFNALASEKKIAVFETDDKGNAINLISELTIKNFEISSSNDDVLKMAVLYINQYYTKDFRLDALARLCDISKSYLCKLFKQKYGKGITEYITELRLHKACVLLEKTDHTAVSIANDTGYVDCGYFNRLFKKHFGVTPLEYRKNPSHIML